MVRTYVSSKTAEMLRYSLVTSAASVCRKTSSERLPSNATAQKRCYTVSILYPSADLASTSSGNKCFSQWLNRAKKDLTKNERYF